MVNGVLQVSAKLTMNSTKMKKNIFRLKACVRYFSLFLKEQYVSWLFQTKYFEIKFNLQLLYLPIVSRAFILS